MRLGSGKPDAAFPPPPPVVSFAKSLGRIFGWMERVGVVEWGMRRLWLVRWILAVLLMALPGRAAERMNVIVILVDDLGWTDLSCYGSTFYETPNLDRLAKEGMRFTDGYSACTVCSPTRASLLTGQYPARLHITDWIPGEGRTKERLRIPEWRKFLPAEEITIAERLKEQGYATASIGKWHLGRIGGKYAEAHGFDQNIGGYDRGQPPSFHAPYQIPTLEEGPEGEYLTDREAKEGVKFIETHRDQPFFIYLPHYAVHTPIQGKADLTKKYQGKDKSGSKQRNAAYAAMIESMDDALGTIVAALERLDLDERTAIVFTGDNGGLVLRQITDNSPLRVGKGSAYEGGVRVPLIVKWPGVTQPGSVCSVPAITPDIYPTVLEMTGSPKDGRAVIDGKSLGPVLRGGQTLEREAIYWHYPHYHSGGATPYSAIRKGDWKLIHFFEGDRVELYDLRNDISESKDLSGEQPEKVAEMKQQLTAWRTSVKAQLPTPNPDYKP
jgi:arylsulfatase A-like enzyme